MVDYTLHIPTKLVFGRESYKQVGALCAEHGMKKVLLLYGGGSVIQSGLFTAVTESLTAAGVAFVPLGGVRPNPSVDFAQQAADLARAEGVSGLLAVGGGSVIDTAKFAAHAVANNASVRAIFDREAEVRKTLPVATILTISAAGSESSDSAVLSDDARGLKRGLSTPFNYPVFSLLDPALTFGVSPYQTACGIVDILMHTMERYMRLDEGDHALMDSFCEALCKNVIEAGRKALANPADYDARATLMLAGSLSHNGLMGMGSRYNMSAHKLEHEMSAIDAKIAHGAGLAVVWPAYLSYVCEHNPARAAQYAKNIWGCEGADEAALGKAGVEACRAYFKEIGMPGSLRELGLGEADIPTMARGATAQGAVAACKPIGEAEAEDILRRCL